MIATTDGFFYSDFPSSRMAIWQHYSSTDTALSESHPEVNSSTETEMLYYPLTLLYEQWASQMNRDNILAHPG